MSQVEELIDEEVVSTTNNWGIVVFNDLHNSFDWVIESFVTVLKQGTVQAEQNATIIHHKGKARVKTGTFEDLQPLERALSFRGLETELTEC